MAIRDILVQIDERPDAFARALVAAQLAMRHGARLTGVFLKSGFMRLHGGPETLGYLSPAQFDALLQKYADAMSKHEGVARAAFEAAARQSDALMDWRAIESDRPDPLVSLCRQYDLAVLPTTAGACLGQSTIPAGQVAIATGGPVLVLPETGQLRSIGHNILVAWKDARESSRALRDAMPLLAAAEKVTVLVIPDTDTGFAREDLERHLRLHCCACTVTVENRHGRRASEIIRDYVGRTGADLLVMGLYGRPRAQEIILGGVSRNMLRNPPAPLFVSH
jgi:nucleotide-binding universal stress UspA family protein